ncbi:hypothetical protein N7539_006079 [Penicillium diatomitis]|uniref:Uncharacterized protein n=1 Tax=Penicillium diatomitis TaxID=2819901 RepID=A0A9X0BU75_9EURO|nr:uncharacterized protein N7539_006079 [Penicillium diatomitis]KAJ5483879.1 hypothetical protein N7539_006079 [Penicillium diatomitis]
MALSVPDSGITMSLVKGFLIQFVLWASTDTDAVLPNSSFTTVLHLVPGKKEEQAFRRIALILSLCGGVAIFRVSPGQMDTETADGTGGSTNGSDPPLNERPTGKDPCAILRRLGESANHDPVWSLSAASDARYPADTR